MVLFFDLSYTAQLVLIGSILTALCLSTIGVFFTRRNEGLFSDIISHAILPGVVISFFIADNNLLIIILCCLVIGILASSFYLLLGSQTKLGRENALGITLSCFFSFGILLISWRQNRYGGDSIDFEHFFFGNITYLDVNDILLLSFLTLLVFSLLISQWRVLELITFDREYAITLGFPVLTLDLLFLLTGTLVIILGVQIMGVILISTLVIGPAVISWWWSASLRKHVIFSGIIGVFSAIVGTLASTYIRQTPVSSAIGICIGILVLFSSIGSRYLRRNL